MGMGVSSGICRSSLVVCMRLVLTSHVRLYEEEYYIISGNSRLVITCVAVIYPADYRCRCCCHRSHLHHTMTSHISIQFSC
jgi:hypothetical protein